MKFAKYTYGVASDSLPISESFYAENYDKVVSAAGFDSENLIVGELTEDWNGHGVGSMIVTGLTTDGHPFTSVIVLINDNKFDFDTVANLMDDELRQGLNADGITDKQQLIDEYCKRHLAKYGEEFKVD
jgi:hypothetical protein